MDALMRLGCGIELTASAVRGAVFEARSSSGELRCVAVQEVACQGTDGDALTRALSSLQRALRVRQPVVLGLPPQASILLTVDPLVPSAPRAALAVQFELQQHLPFAVSDASWHFGWLMPQRTARGSGRGAAVLASQLPELRHSPGAVRSASSGAVVAAIRRQLVHERLAACRRAGISVQALTVSSLGVLDAYAATHTAGVAMLARWTGPMSLEWIVALPDRISVIPMTASSLEAFPQEWEASWEALRTDVPQAPEEPTLIEAPDWARQLGGDLAAPQIWSGEELFRGAGTRVDAPERFFGAAGLAMQGLGRASFALNLIAEVQETARTTRVRRLATASTALCVAAGMAFAAAGMLEARRRKLQALELLAHREQLYRTLRPEIRQLLREQERVQARAAQLEQLASSSPVLIRALAQVTEALPDEVWLTRLESAQDSNVTVLLEGRAKSFQDVTRFLDRLKSLQGITGVKPLSTTVATDEATGKELVAFSAQVVRGMAP